MVIYSDYNRHFINLVLYLFVWFLFIPLPSHAIPDDDNITFHIVEKDGTGLPFTWKTMTAPTLRTRGETSP